MKLLGGCIKTFRLLGFIVTLVFWAFAANAMDLAEMQSLALTTGR